MARAGILHHAECVVEFTDMIRQQTSMSIFAGLGQAVVRDRQKWVMNRTSGDDFFLAHRAAIGPSPFLRQLPCASTVAYKCVDLCRCYKQRTDVLPFCWHLQRCVMMHCCFCLPALLVQLDGACIARDRSSTAGSWLSKPMGLSIRTTGLAKSHGHEVLRCRPRLPEALFGAGPSCHGYVPSLPLTSLEPVDVWPALSFDIFGVLEASCVRCQN